MDLWCPFAEKRPLGRQTEPKIGTPRVLLFHTMVGFLRGTEIMFKRDGYGGTESTFGVGGSWDAGLDGAIWQWQSLDHQADAQFDGNAYATSIETSDGGNPGRPWSDKQAESLIKLGVWWCTTTKNPAKLVTSTKDRGVGFHAQFTAWNRSAHACPGSVRLGQLRSEIIPEIAHRLSGTKPTPPPVDPSLPPEFRRALRLTDPMQHGDDVKAWQTSARRHVAGLDADGWYGPQSQAACHTLQGLFGVPITGVVDEETWVLTFVVDPGH
jgi:hypothetical protein